MYEDILDKPHPELKNRHRMDRLNRAKIFAPFAALKGYEEEIEAKKVIIVPEEEMSQDMLEEQNETMRELIDRLNRDEHPMVTIVYYDPKRGENISFTGLAARISITSGILQVVDRKIKLENVRKLKLEIE